MPFQLKESRMSAFTAAIFVMDMCLLVKIASAARRLEDFASDQLDFVSLRVQGEAAGPESARSRTVAQTVGREGPSPRSSEAQDPLSPGLPKPRNTRCFDTIEDRRDSRFSV